MRGSSFDNRANRPPGYADKILTLYQGTRLGRQEVGGELLEDDRALWSYALLDRDRIADIFEGSIPQQNRGERRSCHDRRREF